MENLSQKFPEAFRKALSDPETYRELATYFRIPEYPMAQPGTTVVYHVTVPYNPFVHAPQVTLPYYQNFFEWLGK